ncbi:MAG: phage tail protein [Chloroflexota bacterium]|nr:phage tail protein [Chloroflexota bacterium]
MAEIISGVVRDWKLEVAAYTTGAPPTTWVPVLGITEFTPPAIEKNLEDDSSFDSDGWGSEIATGLAWTVEGSVKRARASLTEDPGQAILRAAGEKLLEGGLVHIRISNRTTPTTGRTGIADATFTDNGGPHTDLTTAEFSLAGRGALTTGTIVVAP